MTVVLTTKADLFVDIDDIHAGDRATAGFLELSDGRQQKIAPQLLEAINYLIDRVGPEAVGHVEVDAKLIPPERAGALLGVTRQTIYAWQDRGLLARQDVGKKRMVPWASIQAFLADQADRSEFRKQLSTDSNSDDAVTAAAARFDGALADAATRPVPRTGHRRRPERRGSAAR